MLSFILMFGLVVILDFDVLHATERQSLRPPDKSSAARLDGKMVDLPLLLLLVVAAAGGIGVWIIYQVNRLYCAWC